MSIEEREIRAGRKLARGHGNLNDPRDYGHTPGNLANMKEGDIDCVIGSPPYADTPIANAEHNIGGRPEIWKHKVKALGYSNGQSPGQLGSMKEGSIDAVISSPPFADSIRGQTDKMSIEEREIRAGRKLARGHGNLNDPRDYGHTPGNLANMKEGDISVVISSPPFEGSLESKDLKFQKIARPGRTNQYSDYGNSDGQLGNSSGDTFWSASREIVQGCFELLKPGGHAIWVCKDYVKAKKRVPFSDRWLALCESVGFTLVCRHQAMLVKEHGTQTTIHGDKKITTERKSFFRRLAESKGSPRIDFEDVICTVK